MILLGLVSLTILFTWASIFQPIRDFWPKALTCSQCVGFWVGFLGGLFDPAMEMGLIGALLRGATVSTLAFALSVTLNWMLPKDDAASSGS